MINTINFLVIDLNVRDYKVLVVLIVMIFAFTLIVNSSKSKKTL